MLGRAPLVGRALLVARALLVGAVALVAAPTRAQPTEEPTWEPGGEWQPAMAPPRAQWSLRYGFGLGAASRAMGEDFLLDTRLRLEQTLRTEVLFGKAGDEHFRVGPALDLRFQRFDSAEFAGGLAVLFPIARGYPIVLTAAAGYAFRGQPEPDGGFLLGTLAWGYRSYNFHSFYGLGLQLYVSTRVHMDDFSHYEITAGIEIDLAAMAIPVMFLIGLFRGGSPDEPEEVEE